MHPKLSLVITSPTNPSFLVKTRSSSTPLLVSFSTTCIRKLSTHHWNCLYLVCFAYPANIKMIKVSCKNKCQGREATSSSLQKASPISYSWWGVHTHNSISTLAHPLTLTCKLSTCSSSSSRWSSVCSSCSLNIKSNSDPSPRQPVFPKRT